MTKLRKCFGGIGMTWPKVLIFAVISAVYTAAVNLIPALNDTSLQDIAVNPECWLLFAVFIIMNCGTWKEASLKCFVFFLVSQPLIYLIEVPFNPMGWGLFEYYGRWFIITVLTLPGAVVAFQLKRKNWLSAAALAVATGLLAWLGASYFRSALSDFPHHILSAVFCIALAVFFVFVLLDDKKHRAAVLAVTAVVFLAVFFSSGRNPKWTLILPEGEWSCEIEDENCVAVEIGDDNTALLKARHDGYSYVTFTNAEGDTLRYYITVSGGSVWADAIYDQ